MELSHGHRPRNHASGRTAHLDLPTPRNPSGAGEDDGLFLVRTVHRLVPGGVPTGNAHPDAGRDLLVALDHLQSPFRLENAQVLRFVRWFAARIRMAPGFQLGRLDDVARPRKERCQLTVPARGD